MAKKYTARCACGVVKFEFNTDLMETSEAINLDMNALDFPIAIVSFDTAAGWFYYNEEYTSNIKREIHAKDLANSKH